jgi:mono/diheme cytochrome c family protein
MRLSFSACAMLLVLACGDRPPQPEARTDTTPPQRPGLVPPDSVDADLFARGRGVHDAICFECHVLEPPPATAPTFREILARYRATFLDSEEGIEHLTDYIREPAPGKSLLSQVMLDEWGLMPAQPLPEEDLRAAAYFIWYLPDTLATR